MLDSKQTAYRHVYGRPCAKHAPNIVANGYVVSALCGTVICNALPEAL